MRVLLDEQLPRQLARYLPGHDVRTVQQQSWAGLKNGALLTEAEHAGFSVFLTGDRSLEYQQNLRERKLGVIVLAAASNALEDLVPLVPETLAAIESVQPGQVLRVAERPPAG
jgi:predicted nuclease of predicted toxin-antitoxin system